MRSFVLSADRKFFPAFNLKFSPRSALPFVIECLLIFLFASVDKFGFALALGLFCGLVYARQNILLVTPCFVVACYVFTLDWKFALYALAPMLVLVTVYAIFLKLKRNVPIWAVALGAVVGMAPYIVIETLFNANYLFVGLSVVIVIAGTFCASIVAYAVFVRGIVGRATLDELMCAGLLLVAFGFALGRVNIYEFFVFPLVFSFFAVLLSACLPTGTVLFASILLGIGVSLNMGSLLYVGWAAVVGGLAIAFSPFSRLPSALAVVAVESVLWLVNGYFGVGWQSLVMVAVGAVIALAVPRSTVNKIRSLAFKDSKRAYSSIVNLRGKDLANRLYFTSDVFFEMSKTLEKIATERNAYTPDRLAKDVAKNYCAKCEDREACFSALGDDTHSVLEPMATAALVRGKTSILDMPPFITSRCSKMRSLATVINNTAEAFREKNKAQDGVATGKMLLSEQFAGVALVLDALANDCGAPVSFSDDEVEGIKSELLRHNIVASDVVVSGKEGEVSVALIVRAQDAEKQVLAKTVSKLLRTRLEVARIGNRGREKSVYLEPAPVYEVAYGIAERMRTGEDVSGDSRTIQNITRTRRLFAICDGMGSGEKAKDASLDAISMIESFYRAGLANDIVLSLVNRLLKISLEDNFSSLDISVIDVKTGALDVIKLGSASSFIVRKDSVEAVACSSLPAGVLDSASPTTLRFQLFDGDMLVMMSDGVYDALDAKGVVDVIDYTRTSNPQTLANELLKKAVELGAEDDCTVLVMRLFCA